MQGGKVVSGKFGKIELSPSMVSRFAKEATELDNFLRDKGFEGISGWLADDVFIGCRESALQQDLSDMGFYQLSSEDGFAWFLEEYFH